MDQASVNAIGTISISIQGGWSRCGIEVAIDCDAGVNAVCSPESSQLAPLLFVAGE
ncbi:hypothetical protein [Actinacidiphila oryziradicis]|uniref:hypothetical protein n=1 Tax=Actinacidiphila oryziradicis TaxID=2571141 RepID=UPI00145FA1D9|nr:hypothetical protein [Actinacidiphila oryziradicis]